MLKGIEDKEKKARGSDHLLHHNLDWASRSASVMTWRCVRSRFLCLVRASTPEPSLVQRRSRKNQDFLSPIPITSLYRQRLRLLDALRHGEIGVFGVFVQTTPPPAQQDLPLLPALNAPDARVHPSLPLSCGWGITIASMCMLALINTHTHTHTYARARAHG